MDLSRALRKRAFEVESSGIDSSTDVLEYSSEDSDCAVEKMDNSRSKGKEIMVQDVTVVDDDLRWLHMIDEGKLGGDYKGKGLLYAANNESDSDDKKKSFSMEQSSFSTSAATDVVMDGDYSDNLDEESSDTEQDDFDFDGDYYLEEIPENQWYGTDDISYLQSQFEKTDIPPDIEVDIPWWSDPGHKNGKSINLSGTSSGNSTRFMLDSGGESEQTAVSLENNSTGGSISSTGISCTNGSNLVPYKHGSLLNNYAADSFTKAQTQTPDESLGTLQPKSIKEAAMTRLQQFEKFAVVDDYSDHHYANSSLDMQLEKVSAKKIMDEWKILQSSLPDTIFVRVYESKMDLLRAVIIGPQGTPYHDCLFFFDVMFPSNYPNKPPQVHYYSGGLRLNPNLYETGLVCLSLLGTWHGRSSENWIPGKSTLLQVLISIQALILNAKPYFNEPGVSQFGDKNASELYNEDTLLKSLKTMTYSMKKPPRNFEEFVPDYFITRSRDILLACTEYMKGAQVGSVSIVDGNAVKENYKQCSRNFRHRIGCFLNSLIDEFAKLGVNDCDEFRVPAMSVDNEEQHFAWSDPVFTTMPIFYGSKPDQYANFNTSSSSHSHSQFMSLPFPATTPGVPYPYPIPPSNNMLAAATYSAGSHGTDAYPPIPPPSNMYAAPYPPPRPSGDHATPIIPQPSPLSTMTSQLLFPQLVPYPFPPPHYTTAMAVSSSTPWNNPSLTMSVHPAYPPIRFGPPQSHLNNVRPDVIPNPQPPAMFQPVPQRPLQNVNPVNVNPNTNSRSRPSRRRPPMPNHPSNNHSWRKPNKSDDDNGPKGNVHKWSDC